MADKEKGNGNNSGASIPDDIFAVYVDEFAIIEEPEEGVNFDQAKSFFLELVRTDDGIPTRILIDGRGAKATRLSYREIYQLVGELLAEIPQLQDKRIALLDRFEEGFEKTQFFEASAREEGFNVRSFLDFEKAVHWLRNGD